MTQGEKGSKLNAIMTLRQKKLQQDIDSIRSLMYPDHTMKGKTKNEVLEEHLEDEKREIIRNFIVSAHLLSESFLSSKITNFFSHPKHDSEKELLFTEQILEKLSYKEKIELAFKSGVLDKKYYDFLTELNKLRNLCVHRWMPGDKHVVLSFGNKNLFIFENFHIFFHRVIESLHEED